MPCPSSSDRAQHGERGRQGRRAPGGELGEPDDRVGGEQAGDREDRAAASARRSAPGCPCRARRGSAPGRARAGRAGRRRPAGRGRRRPPRSGTQPSPQVKRPQVVEVPRALRQAELAQRVVGGVGLVLQAVAEGREVEHGVGVGDDEGAQRDDPRQHEPARRRVAPGRRRQADRAGRHQRQQHDAAGVLRRARQPEPDAGEQVVAQAPLAQHARGAPQRQGDRRQRRHVVERQVRVEDGEEGDRQQRRGQQARGAAEELGARQVQQPHRQRADRRGGEARDDEDLGRVGRAAPSRRPRARRTRRRRRRAARYV